MDRWLAVWQLKNYRLIYWICSNKQCTDTTRTHTAFLRARHWLAAELIEWHAPVYVPRSHLLINLFIYCKSILISECSKCIHSITETLHRVDRLCCCLWFGNFFLREFDSLNLCAQKVLLLLSTAHSDQIESKLYRCLIAIHRLHLHRLISDFSYWKFVDFFWLLANSFFLVFYDTHVCVAICHTQNNFFGIISRLVWFPVCIRFFFVFFNLFIAFNTFHRCSTRSACRNWVSILCMLHQVRRMCEQWMKMKWIKKIRFVYVISALARTHRNNRIGKLSTIHWTHTLDSNGIYTK